MEYDWSVLDPTVAKPKEKTEPLPAWAGGYDMQALDPTVKKQAEIAPTAPQEKKEPIPWKDVLGGAVDNFLPNARDVAAGMVRPITAPVQTAKDVWKLATDSDTQKAVGNMYANRYGSLEGLKQAIRDNPAEVLQDIATVATLGGGGLSLAGKAAGAAGLGKTAATLGKAGRVASTANLVDPVGLMAEVGTSAAIEGLGNLGKSMWTSAAKPTTAVGRARDRAAAIRGAMEENIPVSQAGLDKSLALREQLKGELGDALSGYTDPTIPSDAMLSDLLSGASKTTVPELRDPAFSVAQGFVDNPRIPDKMTPGQANKLKQEYQKLANYNTLEPTPTSSAYETLARSLRRGIEETAPEVKDINARLAGQIALEPILRQALARGDNLNPISLPAYIGGGAGAGVGAMLGGGPGAGAGSILGFLASQALSKPSTLSSMGIGANRLAGLMDDPLARLAEYGYNWYGRPAVNMAYGANNQ